jgi:MFS family permease
MVAAFGSAGATMGVGTVLGLHAYDLTRREFDLGLLGIAQFAPSLVLVLLTGSVADRFDRARVFSLSAFGQAAVVFVLAGYAASDPTSAGPIFILVVVFGVARAFTTSAQAPLIADLVPREHLPWLIPRRTLITRLSGIIGPILAGTLYAVEPAYSYLAIGSFLVIAGGAAALIPPAPPLTDTHTRPTPGAGPGKRAVVLAGAPTFVVASAYAMVFPVLRRFDSFPQEAPDVLVAEDENPRREAAM